jgi:hypothetical protein
VHRLTALLILVGCAELGCAVGVDESHGDAGEGELTGDGFDGLDRDTLTMTGPAGTPGRVRAFQLAAGAFPGSGHPDVVVYLPANLDPRPPLDVIVFLHGWYNCAGNVVGAVDSECTAYTGKRHSYALAAQLEAAHKNAILIVPELAYDRPSGDPGRLAVADGFADLIDETLTRLAPDLGVRTAGDLGRIVVASHSGGYQTAAAIAHQGGLPIDELYLLDSLYGRDAEFDGWIAEDRPAYAALPPVRRFASVYTQDGGTLAESQAMAARAIAWFAATPQALRDDRTTATWAAPEYEHGMLFKRSGLSHDAVPRYYVGRFLATSALADQK